MNTTRVGLALLALAFGIAGIAGCSREKPPAQKPPEGLPAKPPPPPQAGGDPAKPPPPATAETYFCPACSKKDWGGRGTKSLNTPCKGCGVNLKNRWKMVYCVKCSKKLGTCMICGGPK